MENVLDVADDEFGHMAEDGVEEAISDEVFSNYKFREVIPGCLPHPGDIVESGSLGAIDPLPCSYPLADSIPQETVISGKLSGLQLEGVMYACQRHQILLGDGSRAGFFIGDAAGVGKGRQIAGILLDNYVRGRTKHVWFSLSSDLIVDAKRDLEDIGCYIKVIEGCQQLDKMTKALGLATDFKDGVMFCTYSTLVSSVSKGGVFSSARHSRQQQLVDWCGGPNFDGCLIFDECHKAKHFVPGNEQASTKVAVAVNSLQKQLPKARVVYCSATGVSDVKNMAFMQRLGLWGEGAAFRSFEVFLDTVQKKGLGVAEMLAMDMKSSGIYVCRSLSFKQAEFVTLEVSLTKEQKKMYDVAAHVWSETHKALQIALQRTHGSNGRIWATYWAAHQRFFRQLCLGMKVPTIIEESKSSLEAGFCVVIGLQTTGEASLQNEINKKNGIYPGGFVSLCREILKQFLEQHFPTLIEPEKSSSLVSSPPVADEWCCKAKEALINFSNKIQLPNGSLDEIIDKLGGPDCVAEMTGRRWRIIRTTPNGQPALQLRASDAEASALESLNVTERNLFMSGQKLVAIISDAASTGISLHADSRAANQKRRLHLTIELPWSADKAVQQLGRSHRSNQTSGPLYKLVTTNIGGEYRFASAVARRLQSLGALTKGDRRAATGADLGDFNFDTPYGRSSLRTMYDAICQRTLVPGVKLSDIVSGPMELDDFHNKMIECLNRMDVVESETLTSAFRVREKESRDVGRFLNRILGLGVDSQSMIFGYFTKCLSVQIAGAKREGRYNEGLVDLVASSVQVIGDTPEVFKTKSSQNNPTRLVTLLVDRGMSWEKAKARLENHPGKHSGFYCSQRDVKHKRLYILATPKEGSSHLYKISRANTGVSHFDEELNDLLRKYTPVTADDAEKGWKHQYETSVDVCMHGPRCRSAKTCSVGMRCYKVHLLCGGTTGLMSLLEFTLAKYAAKMQLTKNESSVRVVRAQLDDGQRIIGVRYPQVLIPLAEQSALDQQVTQGFLYQTMQNQELNGTADVQIGPSIIKASATSSSSITVEPVSSVIPKCVLKATTPPVTITRFFKPKSANGSADEPDPDSGQKQRTSDVSNVKGHFKSISNGCELQQNAENDEGERQGHCSEEKDEVITSHLKSADKSKSKSAQLTLQSKVKRPSTSRLPATKKIKQSSIMTSFLKGKSTAGSDKTRNCPICGSTFNNVSNEEVNRHIDNCLIE